MWLYGSGFPKSMNIGLAVDKKNGVDNRTGNIKTDGNDYLKLIEEELKKQGVENIEWK